MPKEPNTTPPPPETVTNQSDFEPTSTDTYLRYTAYANRFRTILSASHRYVAYTSDIGESFRPVTHPSIVKAGYGISWGYILVDVSFETWKARLRQEGKYTKGLMPWNAIPDPNPIKAEAFSNEMDWRWIGLKRALFQSIASMGLPAFTIHSCVRYSSFLFKDSKSKQLKAYGPVGVGLAIVPILPYLFDEPVERVTDYVFDKGWEMYSGGEKKLE